MRDALTKLPDEAPSLSVQPLEFLDDAELEISVRQDVSTSYSAFANAEYKAASVLAGSVIEALLLWALDRELREARSQAIRAWNVDRQQSGLKPRKLSSYFVSILFFPLFTKDHSS